MIFWVFLSVFLAGAYIGCCVCAAQHCRYLVKMFMGSFYGQLRQVLMTLRSRLPVNEVRRDLVEMALAMFLTHTGWKIRGHLGPPSLLRVIQVPRPKVCTSGLGSSS